MEFEVLSEPKKIYLRMLNDIEKAQKSIYLETYIYDDDSIGDKFLKLLIKKAKQGVRVKLLLDAMGSSADRGYFKELVALGGEVKFFREIRYVFRFFSENHQRNHRKLLLIDDRISYMGSSNITNNCLDWRELVIRLTGNISEHFVISFDKSWNLAGGISATKIRSMFHRGYEIIQDIPSKFRIRRPYETKFIHLINSAKKIVRIETPYFVPPRNVRRSIVRALKRGVEVVLILPQKSDLFFIDAARNLYLGKLLRKGTKIYYFTPSPMHSKLLIVDSKFFLLGSSNLDYRSLHHQHEINLVGKNRKIINELERHFSETLSQSREETYAQWKNRSRITRFFEKIAFYWRRYL